jgi:hypothetical protein
MGSGAEGNGSGPGNGIGTGHIENEELDPTELGGERHERQARTEDSGEGASTSEIIAGAASGGFATTPYRQVYQEYSQVHEEVMDRDQIPGGYRFYIRRYFDLIAPR